MSSFGRHLPGFAQLANRPMVARFAPSTGARRSGAAAAAAALLALLAGREVADGHWAIVLLAIGLACFLAWAAINAEHAALGVLVALPFTVYPASVGGFSIFTGAVLAGAVSIPLLLAQRGSLRRLRRRLSIRAFGVLFVAAAVATLHSTDVATAGSRLLYLALFGLFAWALAASIMEGRLQVRTLALAVVASASLAAIALTIQAAAQFVVGTTAVENWLNGVFSLFGGQKLSGPLVSRNWVASDLGLLRGIFPFMTTSSAGQYMMMGLVAAVWLLREGERRAQRSLLSLVAIGLVSLGLLATLSRSSWVGAFAGLGALTLRRRPGLTAVIILLLFLLLVTLPVPGAHQTFGDYLLTASDTSTTSSSTRLSLLGQAVHLVPKHWLAGVGPGLFDTLNPDPANPVYTAHNVVLDEAVELGVVGSLALVFTFLVAMRSAYRRQATLGFAMLASYAVATLFDDALYIPRTGLLLAVAFALAAGGEYERRPSATVSPMRARRAHSGKDTTRLLAAREPRIPQA